MPMPEICVRRYAEARRYEVAHAHSGKARRPVLGRSWLQHPSLQFLCANGQGRSLSNYVEPNYDCAHDAFMNYWSFVATQQQIDGGIATP
jgi:hypothetical protein